MNKQDFVYNKVAWHSELEDEAIVIRHFCFIMKWLHDNQLLSEEGEELYELGVDEDSVLHKGMLRPLGNEFMSKYYEQFMNASAADKSDMDKALAALKANYDSER